MTAARNIAGMVDVLSEICAAKRNEVNRAKVERPEVDLSGAPPVRHLDLGMFSVIAEVKRASPSAGAIAAEASALDKARSYEAAGAAAISVLTDEKYFGGRLADLQDVRAAVSVPVLRKDFIIDSYQVAEARVVGADVVLLIVAALDGPCLLDLADQVRSYGMIPLVEIHDLAEASLAAESVADGGLVGVNARNLSTLDVDHSVWEQAAEVLPAGVVRIAESGVRSVADVARAVTAGYQGVLCGEVLMRSDDPATMIREMLTAAQP